LLLTNYLEFRWYVEGKHEKTYLFGSIKGTSLKKSGTVELEESLTLLTRFIEHKPAPIGNAIELAVRMAKLTKPIRDILDDQIRHDRASKVMKQFHEGVGVMIDKHMEPEQFADMFAQSLAYGLFVAKTRHLNGPFRIETAAREIPRSNPFLRGLFEFITGTQFDDETYSLEVRELTDLLANADMPAILADFGKRSPNQDPLIHFYETYLNALNPSERERRGVYYTPFSVVSYIVDATDEVLTKDFHCVNGLADKTMIPSKSGNLHRVLILDPACGTGSFLYGIIDHIRNRFIASTNSGEWQDYVKNHLLTRLFGFEILMAPYAIAHLKLDLELEARDMTPLQREKWACDLSDIDRIGIYLTNTLDDAYFTFTKSLGSGFLFDEVDAASSVKRDHPVMVVIGNPPYSGHSANQSASIKKMIEDYKFVDGAPLGEKIPNGCKTTTLSLFALGNGVSRKPDRGFSPLSLTTPISTIRRSGVCAEI